MPSLSDNYAYLIVNRATSEAVAVDAGEPAVVAAAALSLGCALVAVLTTHYHADHSGGNAELAAAHKNLEIVAGDADADATPGPVTRRVVDGEAFVAAGLAFQALHTPGHTPGHTCFLLDARDGQAPAVFTGDCLFVGGCGRLLAGTAAEMRQSLSSLAALEPATRVFPGHEYGGRVGARPLEKRAGRSDAPSSSAAVGRVAATPRVPRG